MPCHHELDQSFCSSVLQVISCNLEVHYLVHNSTSLSHILSHINPVHILSIFNYDQFYYYPPIYAEVFQVVSFRLSYQNSVCIYFLPMTATCPAHPIPSHPSSSILQAHITHSEQYNSCSFSLCSHSTVPNSTLYPHILI
jgi:hypothetical protein